MNCMKYRYRAALLSFAMTLALSLSGCGTGKYQEITLETKSSTEQTVGVENQFLDEGGSEASPSSEDEVMPVILNNGEVENSEEEAPVAGMSPLDSTLTTDNGFTDTDETVYVTQNLVNIRYDCSTESKIVVQLNEGDSIKRTGFSEAWSRVVFQDTVCYVASDFVTTNNPQGEIAGDVKALSSEVSETSLEGEGNQAFVSNGRVVAIDAGHQAKGDSGKEPAGPGSSTMKAKVAAGAEGISTKLPEYKLTLSVSQKLKRILEERGYKVIMIRETNDVNISNAERAKMANESGASIFVRVHANSLDNSNISGVLTMCQTSGNPYNGELHEKSYTLSRRITDSISAVTGFKNRGVQETDTMSGINWCTIPVSIVEMGFLSNPEEDQKMAQDDYQELIAGGIADGIDAYFAQ